MSFIKLLVFWSGFDSAIAMETAVIDSIDQDDSMWHNFVNSNPTKRKYMTGMDYSFCCLCTSIKYGVLIEDEDLGVSHLVIAPLRDMYRDVDVMFKNRVATLKCMMQIIQQHGYSRELSIIWCLPPFQILCIIQQMQVLRESSAWNDEQRIELAIRRTFFYILEDGAKIHVAPAVLDQVPPGTHDLLRAIIRFLGDDVNSVKGINNCRHLFNVLAGHCAPTVDELVESLGPLNDHNYVKLHRSTRNANNPNHVDSPLYCGLIAVE